MLLISHFFFLLPKVFKSLLHHKFILMHFEKLVIYIGSNRKFALNYRF